MEAESRTICSHSKPNFPSSLCLESVTLALICDNSIKNTSYICKHIFQIDASESSRYWF